VVTVDTLQHCSRPNVVVTVDTLQHCSRPLLYSGCWNIFTARGNIIYIIIKLNYIIINYIILLLIILYLTEMDCRPVAVVIMHVYKYETMIS